MEQLEEKAAIELVEQQAEEKQVSLNQREIQILYKRIGGIPAALVYAIGQRAAGYSLETILHNVPHAEGDVARFCFQGSVEPLRGKKAHAMLMTFALFPRMPSRAAVTYVAGLETDPIDAEEALSQLQRLSLLREFYDRFRMLPLTREYAFAELRAYPDFEQEARERWINWYLRFAQHYGGHDMEEWHVRYDRLDEEWENLLALFDWCVSHERYDVIKAFWCAETLFSVIDFTSIYGHWDDRLTWLSWLMEAAEGRGDWITTLDTIATYANTLTLMGRYEEAERFFKRAQRLHTYSQPQVEARLLGNTAHLYIFLNRFEEADSLLEQAMAISKRVQDVTLRTRLVLSIEYDSAAVLYWKGEIALSRVVFSQVMENATTFGWQWLANYAQNYLADIAIQEGNCQEAEHLLGPGLTMAERNNEKRRTASYKRSFAYLCQKQGKIGEAISWARKAREGYEHLGVKREVQKMEKLIQELKLTLDE